MANKPGKPNIQRSMGISGTAADPSIEQPTGQDSTGGNPKASSPSGHGGKVENDFNKAGEQKPTQRNEGQRTPNSRSDRESHVGGSNQLQLRRGSGGHGGH